MKKSFLSRVLDSKETASSKRLITLIIALHFVVASFAILFLVCYICLKIPTGTVNLTLISSLEKILQYDFYIILSGLGIITSEGLLSMLLNKGTSIVKEVLPEQQPPV
jgi:hypothetical protein